jgi:hypothetical protein
MSDLGDVLELMYTSRDKPLSVRARITHWLDHVGWQRAVILGAPERHTVDDFKLKSGTTTSEEVVWYVQAGCGALSAMATPFCFTVSAGGAHVTMAASSRTWLQTALCRPPEKT